MSFEEIMILDVRAGIRIIRELEEQKIYDTIREYQMHGIDPEDVKKMGTDFYKNFMEEKRTKSHKAAMEKIKDNTRADKIKEQQEAEIERVKQLRRKKNG